jgi:hypothetical protein
MASKPNSGPEPIEKHWTQREPYRSAIERGLEWAAKTPPAETDLDEFLRRIEQERKKARREAINYPWR